MGHGIQLPVDRVFSTDGREWHGLATVPEGGKITAEIVRQLCPAIKQGKLLLANGPAGTIDEMRKALFGAIQRKAASPSDYVENIARILFADFCPLKNHSGIVADFREVRPDLVDAPETSGGLVPVGVHSDGYRVISNAEVFGIAEAAAREAGCEITTAGTLFSAKRFFMSLRTPDGGRFTANGDEIAANLCLITSHDGTLAMEAYDSHTRIVCNNTLIASRETAGNVGFKVYHVPGADFAMKNLPALVAGIMAGREAFKTNAEALGSISVTLEEARQIAVAYFCGIGQTEQVAQNAFNATDGILALFRNGAGNKGQTLWDLVNGATDDWTNGDGTGQKTSKAEKVGKALFGRAAAHKEAFWNFALGLLDGEGMDAALATGEKAIALGKRPRKAVVAVAGA